MAGKDQTHQNSHSQAQQPRTVVREQGQGELAFAEVTSQPVGLFDRLPDHRSTGSLRQAALLQMQRQHGNAHVQRVLARQGRGASAGAATAVPRLRSGPRIARHSAPLTIDSLAVTNATATASDPDSFVTTVNAPTGDVVIDATLNPAHGPAELADHKFRWRGGEAGANDLQRRVTVGSAGKKTVTLTVDGNSKKINIHVVNSTPAPGANPAARLTHTLNGKANPGTNFGLTVVTIGQQGVKGPKVEVVAHLNGNQWVFRVVGVSHQYKVGVKSQGRKDISGPGDSDIRPNTISPIITDLTPPAPGTPNGPPRARFWSETITRAHEEAHVTHFYNDATFWPAQMAALEAEIEAMTINFDPAAANTRSADAVLKSQKTHFQTRADHFHGVADAAEIASSETFAHGVSNPMYTTLLANIRDTVAPPAPANVAAVAASSTSVTLTWTQDNVSETGFVIERRRGRGPFTPVANVGVPPAPFTDTGLQANTSYTYRVAAVGPAGSSPVSRTASVTTPP